MDMYGSIPTINNSEIRYTEKELNHNGDGKINVLNNLVGHTSLKEKFRLEKRLNQISNRLSSL